MESVKPENDKVCMIFVQREFTRSDSQLEQISKQLDKLIEQNTKLKTEFKNSKDVLTDQQQQKIQKHFTEYKQLFKFNDTKTNNKIKYTFSGDNFNREQMHIRVQEQIETIHEQQVGFSVLQKQISQNRSLTIENEVLNSTVTETDVATSSIKMEPVLQKRDRSLTTVDAIVNFNIVNTFTETDVATTNCFKNEGEYSLEEFLCSEESSEEIEEPEGSIKDTLFILSLIEEAKTTVQTFIDLLAPSYRNGAEKDRERAKETFSEMGFQVRDYLDLTKDEFLKTIKDFTNSKPEITLSCFTFVLSTHGDSLPGQRGPKIHLKDDFIAIDEIYNLFKKDNCKFLIGKPKLFFIQACRGELYDEGVVPDANPISNDEFLEKQTSLSYSLIPAESDFVLHYATPPGYYSWRDYFKGSFFIQSLCEEMKYYKTKTVISILLKVNQKISEKEIPFRGQIFKQMPMLETTLRKDFYFIDETPENKMQSEIDILKVKISELEQKNADIEADNTNNKIQIWELTRQNIDNVTQIGELLTKKEEQETEINRLLAKDAQNNMLTKFVTTLTDQIIWVVNDIESKRMNNEIVYSPIYTTGKKGYSFRLHLYLKGKQKGFNTHISLFIQLAKGEDDDRLEWPCMVAFTLEAVNLCDFYNNRSRFKHTLRCSDPICARVHISNFNKPTNTFNACSFGFPRLISQEAGYSQEFYQDDKMIFRVSFS